MKVLRFFEFLSKLLREQIIVIEVNTEHRGEKSQHQKVKFYK